MRRLLALAATVLLATLILEAPAWASPTSSGSVRDGKNISVFHNSDFVSVFGYKVGDPMTVEVFRNGVKIGSASGPAIQTKNGGGLEVNHGPIGAPKPGDCWTGNTPDILSGDRIVVTDPLGTDEILVDNITITSGPTDETTTTDDTSDVVLEGRAAFADGSPIPIEQLDSGELRQASPRFRANPNTVERIPDTTDGWRATYKAPYKFFSMPTPLTTEQQKAAVLNGNHAMGYGHIVPLPPETQVAELPAPGGPALGCEGSPQQDNAVTSTDDKAINIDSSDLLIGGTAASDATAVKGTITDKDGKSATFDATASLSSSPGQKTWSVTIPRSELDTLGEGQLTIAGVYTLGGTDKDGITKQILKDTLLPNAPTVTPNAGIYSSAQAVTLRKAAGDPADPQAKIYYTIGDGTQADPTANDKVFSSQIQMNSAQAQTIKAVVIDGGGNKSDVATFEFIIDTLKPTISSLTPTNGSTITDTTPEISAKVTDNSELVKENIRLFVDNTALEFDYDPVTDVLSATVPTALSAGGALHTVKVSASDLANSPNTAEAVSTFRVGQAIPLKAKKKHHKKHR